MDTCGNITTIKRIDVLNLKQLGRSFHLLTLGFTRSVSTLSFYMTSSHVFEDNPHVLPQSPIPNISSFMSTYKYIS